jgi:hypothetical protein
MIAKILSFFLNHIDLLVLTLLTVLVVFRAAIMYVLHSSYHNYISLEHAFYKFPLTDLKHTTSRRAKHLKQMYNRTSFAFILLILAYSWYRIMLFIV